MAKEEMPSAAYFERLRDGVKWLYQYPYKFRLLRIVCDGVATIGKCIQYNNKKPDEATNNDDLHGLQDVGSVGWQIIEDMKKKLNSNK